MFVFLISCIVITISDILHVCILFICLFIQLTGARVYPLGDLSFFLLGTFFGLRPGVSFSLSIPPPPPSVIRINVRTRRGRMYVCVGGFKV